MKKKRTLAGGANPLEGKSMKKLRNAAQKVIQPEIKTNPQPCSISDYSMPTPRNIVSDDYENRLTPGSEVTSDFVERLCDAIAGAGDETFDEIVNYSGENPPISRDALQKLREINAAKWVSAYPMDSRKGVYQSMFEYINCDSKRRYEFWGLTRHIQGKISSTFNPSINDKSWHSTTPSLLCKVKFWINHLLNRQPTNKY